MIIGNLQDPERYHFLLKRPIWSAAFTELQSLSTETSLGDYPLPGFPDALVKVMKYGTKDLAECRFETHRQHVDLQYTIQGGENIAWLPSCELDPDGGFDEEKDLQFYLPKESQTVLRKSAGRFSIYYPEDAHRPQINDGEFSTVFKAVVKLPVGQV
ncbi:YhcH/YjgK/YiaL family protein [Akkermansiaceae bacterium]|nr:YhcH/YjgK/YiaL family protein [Akkermansiaceae bacterium]